MVAKYGDNNGFGWQLNEVVGAQIVSVPMSLPHEKARRAFAVVMGLVVTGFVLSAVVLNLMLRRIVVNPATEMARVAMDVSRGDFASPELNEGNGKDEMSLLAQSFNRMRRSLEKALKMLEA
jgi:protein-histidine pros-kinase